MIHSNEDRAVMLAASNMGAPLDDCRSVVEVKDFMIQGIMEGFCGQDCEGEIREVTLAGGSYDDVLSDAVILVADLNQASWRGRAEAWAFKCWEDEYEDWLKEIKEYDGKPLPDYWADIDSKLDKMEDRRNGRQG